MVFNKKSSERERHRLTSQKSVVSILNDMLKNMTIGKHLNFLYAGILLLGGMLLDSCISEKPPEPVDCEINPVVIQNITSTEATCGLADGAITIVASGGSGVYEYSIDGTNFQLSSNFNNLGAGNYTITVRDMSACSANSSAIVESDVGLLIEAIPLTDSGCGDAMGAVNITVEGGVPPYVYKRDGGDYQQSSTITNLMAGSYTVLAKDDNGCEISTGVEVQAGTSLSLDVQPVLNANCAITGCHNGGNNLPDFSDKELVIEFSQRIKMRTGNKSMPPGDRSISDEEIQRIACWVNDGSIDN